MDENKEKRMIGNTGYEVRQAFRINGKEILLAENYQEEDGQHHLVCDYARHGIIGEYTQAQTDSDYLTAVCEFTGRITKEAELVRAEIESRGLPTELFEGKDCYPHDYGANLVGEVVAIKPSVFSPEHRRGDNQLVYVVGGNGAMPNPSGNAVYCHQLNTGEHTRFERYQVLGIVKVLPYWAIRKLAVLRVEIEKPVEEKEFAGNYEIIERIGTGQKVFVLGHCEKAPEPYGTWQGYKGSKGNFDWGHYFSDYDTAKTDMHKRAGEEQKRLDAKKRSDGAR